jgi:hypothetical protein
MTPLSIRLLPALSVGLAWAAGAPAGPAGGPDEPVRYIGTAQADATHEGGLPLAVGVKSWQAFRANRAHPELADDFGWPYNHAPMLACLQGRFWHEDLSATVHHAKALDPVEPPSNVIRSSPPRPAAPFCQPP